MISNNEFFGFPVFVNHTVAPDGANAWFDTLFVS